jgi:hypothetical protein
VSRVDQGGDPPGQRGKKREPVPPPGSAS